MPSLGMVKALIRKGRLTIREVDGAPTGQPATLKVSNATLTDNGDGSYSLDVAGGATPATSHVVGFTVTPGFHDNGGASGTIMGTFPATPGVQAILARVETQELRLAPASGKQILWSGGRMTADKYLRILSDYGVVAAIVNPDGDLQVYSEFGNLQEQA